VFGPSVARCALITGGTGFIGSRLSCRLVLDQWDVHIITRPGADLSQLKPVRDKLTIHAHDGSSEELYRIVDTVKPSVVFHLAAMTLAQHRPVDIVPLLSANLVFGTQLVDAMVAANVHRLVNTSTFWQHYAAATYNPTCLYAATKQAFEVLLQYYVEARELSAISLVLYDTYGPNDPRPKLFKLLTDARITQQPLALSPGEQLVDLVYIDDAVNAYVIAANQLLEGVAVKGYQRFAVSTGHPVSLKRIVELYQQVSGVGVPVQWGGREYREREVMIPWQGERLPGWIATTELRDGIQRLLECERKLHHSATYEL
jgi:nucleoside-diphosphate-sugar epimerase